jgi:hypothetical protein
MDVLINCKKTSLNYKFKHFSFFKYRLVSVLISSKQDVITNLFVKDNKIDLIYIDYYLIKIFF